MMRTLEDVVGELRAGKKYSRPCSLLIGAGCSASAGIPTSAGFVELIKREHPQAFARATEKSYPHCMAALVSGLRRDLIVRQINAAKINWAHVAIAQLIANGYVDRVLTTNFDPLVARACALVGEFPAVYDFAASTAFEPAAVAEKAVFHLHGQGTGFVLMNTEQECTEHSLRLGPLFQDAGRGRSWIVVGYSGDNDPVFLRLAAVERFEYGLYWVGYLDAEPTAVLRQHLLTEGKQAYFVKGHDADGFFVELAQKLDCFPPQLVERPFSHMRGLLDTLADFKPPGSADTRDFLIKPRRLLARAIRDHEVEETQDALALATTALVMAGKYRDVQAIGELLDEESMAAMADVIAWSFIAQGNELCARAEEATGAAAEAFLHEAAQSYAQAVRLNPDDHEALNNWGNALGALAESKQGEEADALFEDAADKYGQAVSVKPDLHEALTNWGMTLAARAKSKTGGEAESLFRAAEEKYAQAASINPREPRNFYNWAVAIKTRSTYTKSEDATQLRWQSVDKFLEALQLQSHKGRAYHKRLLAASIRRLLRLAVWLRGCSVRQGRH